MRSHACLQGIFATVLYPGTLLQHFTNMRNVEKCKEVVCFLGCGRRMPGVNVVIVIYRKHPEHAQAFSSKDIVLM